MWFESIIWDCSDITRAHMMLSQLWQLYLIIYLSFLLM